MPANVGSRGHEKGRPVFPARPLPSLSSFRGWTQSATASMPNCLDFGWRSRRLRKSGSLARTCGDGERPRKYAAGGQKLIAAKS